MLGWTATFSTFSDAQFDEATFEVQLRGDQMALKICWYWIQKLKARFLSGDYAEALAAADKAKALLSASAAQIQLLDYFYYAALTVAACYENATAEKQQEWRELLTAHREQLREWADSYAPTFADKHALVSAEIARLEGRDGDAMGLYEQAIRSARDHGFVQNEGLGYEVAARFYAARAVEKIAHVYLRDARYCYLQWGALGKVKQLDERYPHLQEERAPTSYTATIGAPVAQLDVGAMIKASQAVSGEIVLDRLIEILMTIALEHAGAERGLLILPESDMPRIKAEARTDQNTIKVIVRQEAVKAVGMPESILHTVIRTRQSVILEEAWAQNPFSGDPYIREKRARSILCLPLVKQTKLVGVLYLENNLASHVFTPARILLLELLTSQAAISLENARLYANLLTSEERWRNLFENVPVGVALVDSRRRYVAANPAFQRMTGYSESELQCFSPADITHEDDRAATEAYIEAVDAGKSKTRRYEKRYRRKDGAVIWADVAAFLTLATGSAPILAAVAVDITERKRAEEDVRKAQSDLAHASRMTALGELTASIAHEVNQPLAAVVSGGAACLRWLDRGTPNLDEARRAVEWIVMEGNRAAEVIRRVRALVNKTDTQKAPLDINGVIGEVIALVQHELVSRGVSLRMELAPALPPVLADRVQLQQVLINLVMNGIEAMELVTDRARELTIRSRQDENDKLLVTVEDRGKGISAENADRLFKSFFTTKSGGMGMGLSICRSIIEVHGGRISAINNTGPGATFQFALPLHQEDTS